LMQYASCSNLGVAHSPLLPLSLPLPLPLPSPSPLSSARNGHVWDLQKADSTRPLARNAWAVLLGQRWPWDCAPHLTGSSGMVVEKELRVNNG